MIKQEKHQHVICFDGTGNTAENTQEITNVFKLYSLLEKSETINPLYLPGVGTRIGEKISGNIWGNGIDERLKEAYRWFTDQRNNRKHLLDFHHVYIFGFSRGAYIARTFCWLIDKCRIPAEISQCDVLCGYFFNLVNGNWNLSEFEENIKLWQNKHDFINQDIDMLGVWDTVKTAEFGNTSLPWDHALASNVKYALHAMALDELRALFPVLRFYNDKRVVERWFAGNHCDVGGGYPEDGLSNIALQWMLDRAIELGLSFERKYPILNISQPCHDETKHRPWNLLGQQKRVVLPKDCIHETVKDKQKNHGYSPQPSIPIDATFVSA